MRRRGYRSHVALAALLAVSALTAACGSGDAKPSAPVPKVPLALAPASLGNGAFTLTENENARGQFAKATSSALITDGHLWAVRRGQQLVATLQISTLKPKVDLGKQKQRDAITSQIISGITQTITVDSVEVAENVTPNATVYVWFGKGLFEVLQVKLSKQAPVKAEALLAEVIAYQKTRPEWHDLPRGQA
jgi:hypothetical protein